MSDSVLNKLAFNGYTFYIKNHRQGLSQEYHYRTPEDLLNAYRRIYKNTLRLVPYTEKVDFPSPSDMASLLKVHWRVTGNYRILSKIVDNDGKLLWCEDE